MDPYRKKSVIGKVIAKSKDVEEYKNYKFVQSVRRLTQFPNLAVPDKEAYHFKHSGNSGDLIYSIPTMYALAKGKPIHLHLNLGMRGHYGKKPHPLGNLMLNEKMVAMLQPLLMAQKDFASCTVYSQQEIDYDLDLIRSYPFPLNRGNISRWYFYIFAVNADLGKAWLQVRPDQSMSDYIVIARSQRYRQPLIDYSFLKKYRKIAFVGVPQEFKDMQEMLPSIEYRPVEDFLELARVIAGSKLFIGNQSFPFSIAEALKTKRMLEVYHQSPNVNVEGANGYDFCFQPQFEKLVSQLLGE